jgi:NTE family protein
MKTTARRISGPFTMLNALIATMLEAHDERYIEDACRFRTIKLPTLGVRTTQFDISVEKSKALYEAGRGAAEKYFSKWSLSDYEQKFSQYMRTIHHDSL